jgi:hypothetical protein
MRLPTLSWRSRFARSLCHVAAVVCLGAGCSDGSDKPASSEPDASEPACPQSCDDGNPCTLDACDEAPPHACTHANAPDGDACSDGDACNGLEVCQAPDSGGVSTCTPGSAPSCDDGNPCSADSCSAASGCVHDHEPAGFVCAPGATCIAAGTCDGEGTCLPGGAIACDDGNPCTADACDPTSGCTHEVTAGVSCSDGKVCNGDETCDAGGACQPGTPLLCADGNECTADSCDDGTGCVFDASANDGQVCMESGCGSSVCAGGACAPGSGPVCNDDDPCTLDSCVGNGCVHTLAPAGASCSDGDFCNGAETCDAAGACVSGSAPCGLSLDPCKTVSCDGAAGRCVTTNKPNGTACDDSNVCTQSSSCVEGACAQLTAARCTSGWAPGDASACDPVRGCTVRPVCEPFFQGNRCKPLDANSPAGTCRYTNVFCPYDGCYQQQCNPGTGICQRDGSERNILCGINGVGCQTVPQGCGNFSCVGVTCTLGVANPNCATSIQNNCISDNPSTCQAPVVTAGVTNILACQEGFGCRYDTLTDCAATQPLGAPGPCQEYFEDPVAPGCCGLRAKTCRPSDFGLPADTTGYTFSCESTTGACVATPSP